MNPQINWVPDKKINDECVKELLSESIKTGQFTNYGPNVARLESFIKNEFGITKSVICVSNGTTALHALVSGIEYTHSRLSWATQAFTFPSSVQGSLIGTKILDIDIGGGIDLDNIPDCIDGIIVTNVFGNVVDIQKYTQWAKDNNKFLLFDNAATPMTMYNGTNSCNYGTGSIISFHHTKPFGFGEGGAIIVDQQYEEVIRKIINFGLNDGYWNACGSNYKMSDISAVYILQYIYNWRTIVDHHSILYKHLEKCLLETDIILYPNYSDTTPFVSCFSLMFKDYKDEIRQLLIQNGIFCRKYYRPLESHPIADKFYEQILCIPCTMDMTIDNVELIYKILKRYIDEDC